MENLAVAKQDVVSGWVWSEDENPMHIGHVCPDDLEGVNFFTSNETYVVEMIAWETIDHPKGTVHKLKYIFRTFTDAVAFVNRLMNNKTIPEPCVMALRPITNDEYDAISRIYNLMMEKGGREKAFLPDTMIDSLPDGDCEWNIPFF